MPVFFPLIMANYQVVMYTSYTVLLIRDDWVLFYYLSRFSEILMNIYAEWYVFSDGKSCNNKRYFKIFMICFKQKDKIFLILSDYEFSFC